MSWEDTLSALARQTGSRDFSSGLADAGGARDFSGGHGDPGYEGDHGEPGDSDGAYSARATRGVHTKVSITRPWNSYSPNMQDQGNSTGWGNILGTGLANVFGHYFGRN